MTGSNVLRRSRAPIGFVIAVALVVAFAAAAAASGTDSLLQERDLPTGAKFGSGSPRTELGYTPVYGAVDDCELGSAQRFTKTATLYGASFVDKQTGGTKLSGEEQVYDFTDAATAKKFFAGDKAFVDAATKCKKVTTSSGAARAYKRVDAGDVGDARTGAYFTEGSDFSVSTVTFLSGTSVVRVFAAGKLTQDDFGQLVERAEKRFDAAS